MEVDGPHKLTAPCVKFTASTQWPQKAIVWLAEFCRRSPVAVVSPASASSGHSPDGRLYTRSISKTHRQIERFSTGARPHLLGALVKKVAGVSPVMARSRRNRRVVLNQPRNIPYLFGAVAVS